MNTKPIRSIREPLRKPRPLKAINSEHIKLIPDPKDAVIQKSKEEILVDLETLNVSISNCSFDEVTAMDVSRICAILKKWGKELEITNKDALDRYFCTLRNACREERMDMVSRVRLLEIIEFRAKKWETNLNINNYFRQKIQELDKKAIESFSLMPSISSPTIPMSAGPNLMSNNNVSLSPGEVLKSSGKFDRPAKITGKNYFKDEIVIRNSDSGKVNPGARDRLVQITGPHEEAISRAKVLVEDTIRRNASPIRDLVDDPEPLPDNHAFLKPSLQHSLSVGDASYKEHTGSLIIGPHLLTLKSTSLEVLQQAQLVLNNYFTHQLYLPEKHENSMSLNRPPSLENNVNRFQLRRQASLKSSIGHDDKWLDKHIRRDSISPFSSSDDDYIRDEMRNSSEQMSNADDLSPAFNTRSVSFDSSNINVRVTRSASVPKDSYDLHNSSIEQVSIPPPSYRPRKYSRSFLLECAKSSLSHRQPTNYPHIHQTFKDIVCRSPVMFDPEKYEESKPCEFTVLK